MFNKLFSLFTINPFTNMSSIIRYLEQIVDIYEDEFARDHDAHIAAYDALIQILETHKQKLIQDKANEKS